MQQSQSLTCSTPPLTTDQFVPQQEEAVIPNHHHHHHSLQQQEVESAGGLAGGSAIEHHHHLQDLGGGGAAAFSTIQDNVVPENTPMAGDSLERPTSPPSPTAFVESLDSKMADAIAAVVPFPPPDHSQTDNHTKTTTSATKSISSDIVSIPTPTSPEEANQPQKPCPCCCPHLTSSTTTANNYEDKRTAKRVRFSTVTIRNYKSTIGDHPSCRYGPPVSLGWDYDAQEQMILPVHVFEAPKDHAERQYQQLQQTQHQNHSESNTQLMGHLSGSSNSNGRRQRRRKNTYSRNNLMMMTLNATERCARLFQAGYTMEQMKQAMEDIKAYHRQGTSTTALLWSGSYYKLQEFWFFQVEPLLQPSAAQQEKQWQQALRRAERRVLDEHSQQSQSMSQLSQQSVGMSSAMFEVDEEDGGFNTNKNNHQGGAMDAMAGPPSQAANSEIIPRQQANDVKVDLEQQPVQPPQSPQVPAEEQPEQQQSVVIIEGMEGILQAEEEKRMRHSFSDLSSSNKSKSKQSSSRHNNASNKSKSNKSKRSKRSLSVMSLNSSNDDDNLNIVPNDNDYNNNIDHDDDGNEGSNRSIDSDDDDDATDRSSDDTSYGIEVDRKQHDKATEIILCSLKRPHMRAFHAAWFSFCVAFFNWFAITPLLSEVKETLDLDNRDIWISSLFGTAGSGMMRILMGPLCDAFGARLCMAFVLILAAIPTAMTGLIQSSVGLSMVRLFTGLGGSSFVACQYWTSDMFTREVAGTANALVAGWGNLGGGIAQLVMGSFLFPLLRLMYGGHGFVYENDDAAPAEDNTSSELAWRTVFIVPAVLSIGTALLIVFYCDDSPTGSYRERIRIEALVVSSPTESLYKAARNRNSWILALQYACCFGVEVTMTNATALYFHDEFGQSTVSAAAIASIFGLMNLFARGLGGFASDRLQSAYGLKGRLAWQMATLMLEGVGIAVFSYAESLAGAILALVFLSCCVQSAEGSTFGIVPYVDRRCTGKIHMSSIFAVSSFHLRGQR